MIRLQPDWIGDLMRLWVAQDWADVQDKLGYPEVSPMFALGLGSSTEDDVTGYSAAEGRAMSAAVEWLRLVHWEHWRALSRQFRPHLRAELPPKDGDRELVLEAGKMLADYIDKVLG